MGKSKSIDNKAKRNEKFQKYMETLLQQSKDQQEVINSELEVNVKSHFENNNWKYSKILQEHASHFEDHESWSLDSISNIIKILANNLSSGTSSGDTSDVPQASISIFDKHKQLMIKRIVNIVTGVLEGFSTSNTTSMKSQYKELTLAGGIHVFLQISGQVYSTKNFFKNSSISSFQIAYHVTFSPEEAKMFALQDTMRVSEGELKASNRRIEKLTQTGNSVMNKLLDEGKYEEYQEKEILFSNITTIVKNKRDDLLIEIQKYSNITKGVDALVENKNNATILKTDLSSLQPKLKLMFGNIEKYHIAEQYLEELKSN